MLQGHKINSCGAVAQNIQNKFFWGGGLFRATSVAYGSSQANGGIGAAAVGLYHSHSNLGSEPHLQSIPQLMATPDSKPIE